ncbi:hypothetical protein ABBQ32_005648 [Trebouxia sp. C0010 RCD-2024]
MTHCRAVGFADSAYVAAARKIYTACMPLHSACPVRSFHCPGSWSHHLCDCRKQSKRLQAVAPPWSRGPSCFGCSRVQTAEPPATQGAQTKGHVVIIGAGPGGSMAAILLAKRGYKVDVYERRPQPKQDPIDLKRTYIIALSERGLKSMRAAGVSIPSDAPYKGFVRHLKGGKVQVSPVEGNVSFERAELAQHLISEANRLTPHVKYHFEQGLHSIDFDKQTATLQTHDGTMSEVQYDLLIGADGVGSTVRSQMEQKLPGMKVKIEDSGREYKTYKGLKADLEPPELRDRPGRSIHIFLGQNSWTSLSGHLNPDGTYAGTLAMKNGEFKKLSTAAEYEGVIRKGVSGVPEHWIADIAKQCLHAATSPQGRRQAPVLAIAAADHAYAHACRHGPGCLTLMQAHSCSNCPFLAYPLRHTRAERVWCSRLTGPKVMLVGDAAHAVTPVGGQGANAALEDTLFLTDILQSTGDDLASAVPKYDRERLPDAHGLVAIESSFSKLVGNKLAAAFDPNFLKLVVHVAFGSIMHKLLPFIRKRQPALVQLGSDMRYSDIMKEVNRDAATVAALLLAALMVVCLRLAKVL